MTEKTRATLISEATAALASGGVATISAAALRTLVLDILDSALIGLSDVSPWTPVLTCTTPGNLAVGYATQAGRIKKLGNLAVANGSIITNSFTHTTASGSVAITGLPYTSLNVTNLAAQGSTTVGGITKASYTQFTARVLPNTSSVSIVGSGSGVAASDVTITNMPSGGTVVLIFTIVYFLA